MSSTAIPLVSGIDDDKPLDLSLSAQRTKSPLAVPLKPAKKLNSELALSLLQHQLLVSILYQKTELKKKRQRTKKTSKSGTTKRVDANARERSRVQQLGDMFEVLRHNLPLENDVKLSKLATLQIATAYIDYLATTLLEVNDLEAEKKLEQRIRTATKKSITTENE